MPIPKTQLRPLVIFGIFLGASIGTNAQAADSSGILMAIGYDPNSQKNDILKIDPTTASATIIQSISFDSGGWNPGTFTASDSSAYVISSGNTLYQINTDGSINQQHLSVTSPDLLRLTNTGQLIGYTAPGSNSINLYSVDSSTLAQGPTISVQTPPIGGISYFTQGENPQTGIFYFETIDNHLYEIDSNTKIATILPIQAQTQTLAARSDGNLIGISPSHSHFLDVIDPTTGKTNGQLGSPFSSNYIPDTFTIDQKSNSAYLSTSDFHLLKVDASSGTIEYNLPIQNLPQNFSIQAMAWSVSTVPEPDSQALLLIGLGALVFTGRLSKKPSAVSPQRNL